MNQQTSPSSVTVEMVGAPAPRLRPRLYVIAALVIWVLTALALQKPTIAGVLALVSASALAVLQWIVPAVRRWAWLVVGLAVIGLGFAWIGGLGRSVPRDWVGLIMAIAVAALYSRRLSTTPRGRDQLVCFLLLVALTWIFCSIGDFIAGRERPRLNPNRFAALRNDYPDVRVAVALSGGGYRAALVHAGVLAALEKTGIRVTNLSTVSGGSIIGSFYTLGGTPEDFLRIVTRHDFNLKRDSLDAQNLLRLALPLYILGTNRSDSDEPLSLLPSRWGRFTRTDLHAEFLNRHFFAAKTLGDHALGAPELMICATNLGSGELIGIGRNFHLDGLGHDLSRTWGKLQPEDNAGLDLASCVAGSAAFPFVFSPQRILLSGEEIKLVDGGVLDNSGVVLLDIISPDPRMLRFLGKEFDSRAFVSSDLAELEHAYESSGFPDLYELREQLMDQQSLDEEAPTIRKDWRRDVEIDVDAGSSPEAYSGDWQAAYDVMSDQIGTAVRHRKRTGEKLTIFTPDDTEYSAVVQEMPVDSSQPLDPDGWQCKKCDGWLAKSLLGSYERPATHNFGKCALNRASLRDWLAVFSATDFSDLSQAPLRSTFSAKARPELEGWLRSLQQSEPHFLRLLSALPAGPDPPPVASLQPGDYQMLIARRKQVEALAKFVMEDYSRCCLTFRRTSTLGDIPENEALQLFRLGEYLVLLNLAQTRQLIAESRAPGGAIDYEQFVKEVKSRPLLTDRQIKFVLFRLVGDPQGAPGPLQPGQEPF